MPVEPCTIRKSAIGVRTQAANRHGFLAGRSVAMVGLDFASVPYGGTIACFAPVAGELDPVALFLRLEADGFGLALPVWRGADAPMAICAWTPGDTLSSTSRGTREPTGELREVESNAILVPLVAFDAYGRRLGRGGGAYNRTLAALRAKRRKLVAIGIAFDEQAVDSLPPVAGELRLDWVLTPSGAKKSKPA